MANLHIFFLLSTFFLQLHARESEFFSKFTKETPQLLPTTPDQQQQQKQPDFIPQNKDSTGYGLYPSSTTINGGGATDNLPVSTFPENYNTVAFETTGTDSRYNYNGDGYNNQKQDRFYRHLPRGTSGGADVTLPENYNPVAYTTRIPGLDSHQTTDHYNMDDENIYNSEKLGVRVRDSRVLDNGKYYHVGDMYNSEKQGMMSDSRFMENGKYYHDLNSEHFDANMDANPIGNGYNTRGNNDNLYSTRYNSNARFQETQEYMFNP